MKNSGLELCLAVVEPSPEKVKRLLTNGADPNALGDKKHTRVADRTPIWLAVSNAGQEMSKAWTDFYEVIKEAIPIVPERDHSAKREMFLEISRSLIDAGADLETRSFGSTPLRVAVSRKDLEMVSLLLAKGANPNAETYSPISKFAKRDRLKGPLGLMGYYNTVLHEAVEKNVPAVVKALLAAGANPTRTDHEGKTPLEIASDQKFTKIVELLAGN